MRMPFELFNLELNSSFCSSASFSYSDDYIFSAERSSSLFPEWRRRNAQQ